MARTIILDPTREDLAENYISKQAQFYLQRYPDRIWEVPIEINILSCEPQFKLFEKSLTIDYELGIA